MSLHGIPGTSSHGAGAPGTSADRQLTRRQPGQEAASEGEAWPSRVVLNAFIPGASGKCSGSTSAHPQRSPLCVVPEDKQPETVSAASGPQSGDGMSNCQ